MRLFIGVFEVILIAALAFLLYKITLRYLEGKQEGDGEVKKRDE